MRAVFRVDSSAQMGTGHVMRCLTLADELKACGIDSIFLCRDLQGNVSYLIKEAGFRVFFLAETNHSSTINWKWDCEETIRILKGFNKENTLLIVDHYGIDQSWEREVGRYVSKILVIDDLANRKHDCDLLLDQNFFLNMNERYQHLVPNHCKKLVGPRFALLRSEFKEVRKTLRERTGLIKRILIFFGGTDSTNETQKAIETILNLKLSGIEVDIVVGNSNPNKATIKKMCDQFENLFYYCQVQHMASLMANADLAIGAGGTTTWERCYLGLPSITLTVADNQVEVTSAVHSVGATWNLGPSQEVTVEDLSKAINNAINSPETLANMSASALNLVQCEDNSNLSFCNILLGEN